MAKHLLTLRPADHYRRSLLLTAGLAVRYLMHELGTSQ